ncbi:carbohydrate ABC transporter permease [Tessaracoccus antarcticus]|uniref:carbohydrate ABC transporter permease n=1 Tax=Tessaracoccus antarcticus TaxID=2479848 RepID=UPI001314F936|nr:carbohydrate ABC transporter permease [Tessaracoccus antarcticus]
MVGIAILAVLLFPLAWVVLSSFQPTSDFYKPNPTLIPRTFTLENYANISAQFGPLATSLLIAVLSAALSLVIGIPAAYALAVFRWRRIAVAMFLILITQVVPTVMIATPVFLIFSKIGLLNSIPGLVIANSSAGVPFTVLVLTPFIAGIPASLREAAYLDGAGEWRTLLSVIIPTTRSAIIAAGLFSFLFAWGDFLWAVTLNTNGTITPLSLSLFKFIAYDYVEWGGIMATATIALIPATILLIASQRYISLGLTAGAVKD